MAPGATYLVAAAGDRPGERHLYPSERIIAALERIGEVYLEALHLAASVMDDGLTPIWPASTRIGR